MSKEVLTPSILRAAVTVLVVSVWPAVLLARVPGSSDGQRPVAASCRDVAEVMRRAGSHLVDYERDLGSVIAEEEYVQRVVPTREEYVSSAGDHLVCVARYSNFQRFSVSSKIGPGR